MKEKLLQNTKHELKERIPIWLYPSTLEALDRAMKTDNCKSRSEFTEKAIRFYAGYISGEDATSYLPAALVYALRGTLDDYENHIARLLFKLSVETGMMMSVLAAGMEIDEGTLRKIRTKCVEEVKKSNGSLSLSDMIRPRRGG